MSYGPIIEDDGRQTGEEIAHGHD